MSLITCHECKQQISTDAKSCPICGAAAKNPTRPFAWIVAGLFAATIATCSISNKSNNSLPDDAVTANQTPPSVPQNHSTKQPDVATTVYPPIRDGEKDWPALRATLDKTEQKIVAEISRMEWWNVCKRWGKELRAKNGSAKASIFRANLEYNGLINQLDAINIREKHVAIGMTECGVYAAIGLPEGINRTETSFSKRAQLVFGLRKYIYIETKNGVSLVTSMQY